MIDERVLTDATRCPSCGGPLVAVTTCPACGVALSGPTAARLWQVSVSAAELLSERSRLLETLRAEARRPATPAVEPPPAPPAARPTPEWTRRRVQNLLLSLGVGLLAVAAVVFLVVSWSVLGIGGRAVVMTGCTAVAAGAALVTHRRALAATAEAVSLLAVGLALLDAVGARWAGLAGLDGAPAALYWAGALALVAAATGAAAVVVPTRAFRLAAALLAQLPVPLVTQHLAERASEPAAVIATGFAVATLAGLGTAAGWRPGGRSRDARLVVAVGAGLAWFVAVAAAVAAAYGGADGPGPHAGALVAGTVLLVVLAAVAALPALPIAVVPRSVAGAAPLAVLVSSVLLVAAAWAVPVDRVAAPWTPLVLTLVATALLAAALGVPSAHRAGAVGVSLVAAVAPALAAAEPVGRVVLGHLGWLDRPWSAAPGRSARALLGTDLLDRSVPSWGWSVPLLLAAVAVALVLGGLLHHTLTGQAPAAAVPAVGLAVLTGPVAAGLGYPAALAVDLLAGAALALAGSLLVRRRRPVLGATSLLAGLTVLALAAAWSLARPDATVAVLAPVAVLLAGSAAALGRSSSSARLALGVATGIAGLAEAGAIARHQGAGWPAAWSLVLTLAVVVTVGASRPLGGHVRRGLLCAGTAALVADAAALATWSGWTVASAGLAATTTAAVVAVGAVWAHRLGPAGGAAWQPLAADVATTATLAGSLGVPVTALDPDRLWLALLVAGVAAAAAALRPGLHRLGWVAGGLLAASSWVRLALSHVDAPEPYTVPAGLALVALGAWRRRQDPAYPSWRAYGSGLVLVLVPSLLRAVGDAGSTRPLLLGLAALVVLCSGLARRLQAPLAVGGGVLAVDAAVQLSPYLMSLYAAVPRWSLIAGTGLLLVLIGATYERRARELRALQQHIARFG